MHARFGTERAPPRSIVASGDRVLTAYFAARAEVSGAVKRLVGSGIPLDAIRVLPKSVHHVDDIGVRAATKTAEGAALGAIAGGCAGALAGALTAGAVLVVPGIDAVVAGPIVSALVGAGAVGALGVIVGALAGARFPEYEAAYLEDAVRAGGALVSVRCADAYAASVEEILAVSGASAVRRR